MAKKKYCLEKGQLQNVVAAARGEPGTCKKAEKFIENDLGMGKKKKQRKKEFNGPSFVEKIVGRKITNKISDFIDDFF